MPTPMRLYWPALRPGARQVPAVVDYEVIEAPHAARVEPSATSVTLSRASREESGRPLSMLSTGSHRADVR